MEDSYSTELVVDHQPCSIEILDTAGAEQFLALQDLNVRKGEGFLLVFSLSNLSSVNELGSLWDLIRQIKEDGSGTSVPVVLVGNKSDLRSERQVPREIGTNLSRAWGNVPYYETSARKRVNVDDIFIDLVRQIRCIRRETKLNVPSNEQKSSDKMLRSDTNPGDHHAQKPIGKRKERKGCFVM